jgi:hypothetical protein
LTITAFGLGVDYSTPSNAINAFELLMDLLLQAAEEGFDFQWTSLSTKAASGSNPDWASAEIALTSFQFEDFKQFLRTRTTTEDQERFFRIDFSGITETGTRFIPTQLIEVILELDHEWKEFIRRLNSKPDSKFSLSESVGSLHRLYQKNANKQAVTFELRFLPHHDPAAIDEEWRSIVRKISSRHNSFHFSVLRDYLVPGVGLSGSEGTGNSNYLSDSGMFHKAKFPVNIVGAGSVQNLPKGPNEAIRWSELEKSIEMYRDLMLKSSQG